MSDLLLHGVFGKEGLQVLGAALSYLVHTDKVEHVHVGLFLTLVVGVGWELAGILPTVEQSAEGAIYVEKGCRLRVWWEIDGCVF